MSPPVTEVDQYLARLSGLRFAEKFASIQDAITDAGSSGAVVIPSNYGRGDAFSNPSNVPVLDLRLGAGAWFGGVINVRSFGAVGDGVTDDTAAISAAYAAGGEGAIFFYPAGNYLVSGNPALTPPQGSVHIGASRGGATLAARITYGGSGDCVLIDGKQGITFRDLKFVITGSVGTERAIHVTNTAVACQWCNFENLYFLQFGAGDTQLRVAGQVGIYVESTAVRAQYWHTFRRLIFQNWDKGIQFNGLSATAVVNGHKFYDLMGAANVTLIELTKFAHDNFLCGLFASASGFAGAQTAVVVGDGVNPAAGNRFYGVTSDAGVNAKAGDFKAGTSCNFIETDCQSSLLVTDAGSQNQIKLIKPAVPNNIITDTLGTIATPYFAMTYSAAMTPNAQLGNRQEINATDGNAFTVNAPTSPRTGQPLTIKVKNTSGGALGVATWNAVFKLAAWTQPATGNSRSITFHYDGTNWVEEGRTPADVPN